MRRAFRDAGVELTVVHTRCAGDGARVARELAPALDRLFVLGGDGTVMEAATGLAEAGSSAPIGILPAGTGNQLARALSVPLSPRRAVARLLRGVPSRLDVAVLNGHRRVGIGAGLGLDAAMIAGAQGMLKRYLGAFSYIVAATTAALRPRRFTVRAVVDGKVVERDATVAMVLNLGRVFNHLIEIAPNASLVDGQLDLVIVDARSLADALAFSLFEMLLRRRRPDPRWTYLRGESISVETADTSIPAQADGDLLDESRLTMRVQARGARFLVPLGTRLI